MDISSIVMSTTNTLNTLSKSITNSSHVLFTGAGASAPLGCLPTKPFLNKLPEIIFNLYKEQGQDYDKVEIVAQFLTRFFNIAAKHYNTKKPDSEIVLDYIQNIINNCKELSEVPAELLRTDFNHTMAIKTLEQMEGFIQRAIVEHYSTVDGDQADKLYAPLFQDLSSFKSVIPMFTTNYDWVFEQLAELNESKYTLTDGFKSSPMGLFWSEDVFKKFTAKSNRINLVLFKLHGSTSWYKDSNSNAIRKFPEPAPALASSRAVVIYPTQVKDHLVQTEPFKTSYSYFSGALQQAKLLIVIGFSFRDPAINSEIRNSLTLNQNLRLLIIELDLTQSSPKFMNILDDLGIPYEHWIQRLHIIQGKFGEGDISSRISSTISNLDNWDSLQPWDKSRP